MKKLACMLLALAMMLSLAACGGNSGNNAANNGGTDNQTNNQTNNQQGEDTDTGSGELPKVALMSMRQMTQPADLNTLEGVDRLKEEMGLDVNIVVCTEVSEYYDQMQALCEEGYDIIYFVYDNFLEAAKELCVLYPDTMFIGLWIDLQGEEVAPNLKPVHFRSEQSSFMCGVVAALMSETGKVGFIGGGNNPGIKVFLAGYEAGINYVDNGTELMVSWANTFDDPLKGQELALSLNERGCDVIYQAASQTGLGVFQAAQDKGFYAIGVDVDQSSLAPENIICSSLLDHGYATYDTISQAVNGQFNNEQVYYGLQEGMPVIAINEALVSEEIVQQVKDIEQKIIAGEIEIPTTTETE